MGVYSLNRTNLNTIAQVEAEPYSGFVGCYEAMIDMEHNNHVIFEALIQNDFKEGKGLCAHKIFWCLFPKILTENIINLLELIE